MLSHRARTVAFWLFTLACIAATAGYVTWRLRHTAPTSAAATPLVDPAAPEVAATLNEWRGGPHLLFLNSHSDAFGAVSVAKLSDLGHQLTLSAPECERSYFDSEFGLCLTLNRESMQPRGYALILDRHFNTLASLPLAGLPIRARISPDHRYAVSTVFVTGESYAGNFTTRTTLMDLATKKEIGDLEQFAVERDGRPFKKTDFNFWGVTFFRDGDRFLATLGTGGERFLVEGSISSRKFRVVGKDVECPSLSPDERHVVFKRQKAVTTGWQLWALDRSTQREWPITDDGQDIDDQVEWLDNGHVIYGRLFGSGVPETSLSLWISDVTEASGFDQELFVRSASSPSVVR